MKPTPADIIKAVCTRFDLHRTQIVGRNARRVYARPRQIAMYLSREMTSQSFPRLGRIFDRDHTTVLWACRTVDALQAEDRELFEAIESCREMSRIFAGMRGNRIRDAVSKPLVEVREAA